VTSTWLALVLRCPSYRWQCFSGGVKLVQAAEQVHSVRRQLVQVQVGQQSGELLSERSEAVPLLLLEVRLQRLGGQSWIVVPVELAARCRLANGLASMPPGEGTPVGSG
jgi:hypothetical protein